MIGWYCAGFVACLVAAFALAACESAVQRMTAAGVDDLVEDERRGAEKLRLVVSDSAGYLSVTTFVRVSAEMTAAVLATVVAVDSFERLGTALVVAVVVMAIVSFVLVGVSPRTLGRQHGDAIALAAAPTMVWLRRLLGPLARLLVAIGNAVTPGKGYRDGPFANEAELRELVDLAGDTAVIEAEEREMIHSVFELGDTLAREVMVPRTDMIVIEQTKSLRQATSLFLRSGFSRVPVIGEDADDPVGLLYFKDVARRTFDDPDAGPVAVAQVMRAVPFVPESKPVDALLREMQVEQIHLAIVVDEYGGTAGLVTIEDLIEEIVGEIADEYDREAPGVQDLDDGSTRLPASMHVDDFAELFGLDIEEDDVDTVGGLLAKQLGRVPILGSQVVIENVQLTADRMAGRRHRIASVVVRPLEPLDAAPAPHLGDDEGLR